MGTLREREEEEEGGERRWGLRDSHGSTQLVNKGRGVPREALGDIWGATVTLTFLHVIKRSGFSGVSIQMNAAVTPLSATALGVGVLLPSFSLGVW